jgi:hypothetical protein
MLDFWFTLGAAIIDPGVVSAIQKTMGEVEVFTPVQRTITETVNGETQTISSNNPASGLLKSDGVTELRKAIRTYLSAAQMPSPPPISLYAAGRMAQLVQTKETLFTDAIRLAQSAYSAAIQANPSPWQSPLFPAFLGLCLVDQALTSTISEDPNFFAEVLGEFGMTIDTQPEMAILNYMLAYSSQDPAVRSEPTWPKSDKSNPSNQVADFAKAQGLLLGGAGWQSGCREQIAFWSADAFGGFRGNERAILP